MSSEFHAVKGRLPATPTSLKSTTFTLGLENFGINPWCVGSLDNSFGFDWGMDVENGFEGGVIKNELYRCGIIAYLTTVEDNHST